MEGSEVNTAPEGREEGGEVRELEAEPVREEVKKISGMP